MSGGSRRARPLGLFAVLILMALGFTRAKRRLPFTLEGVLEASEEDGPVSVSGLEPTIDLGRGVWKFSAHGEMKPIMGTGNLSQVWFITNRMYGHCMEYDEDKRTVIMKKCDESEAQIWIVQDGKIRSKAHTGCLTRIEGSLQKLQLQKCEETKRQSFYFDGCPQNRVI